MFKSLLIQELKHHQTTQEQLILEQLIMVQLKRTQVETLLILKTFPVVVKVIKTLTMEQQITLDIY
jgi:hypothetical protein